MKWLKRFIRKKFCRNEIPKGEMLVLWKDIDNEVYGWNAKAHNEDVVLRTVSCLIRDKKLSKLEEITGIKKGDDFSPPLIFDDETTGDF